MIEVKVRAEDLQRLSKSLKHAGQLGVRKELHAAVRKAARPLVAVARQSALSTLPHRGGLAAAVARSPMRVQLLTGASTYGVRIAVGNSPSGPGATNRGAIRHPVFGNRDNWVTQTIPAGWFDDAMTRAAPAIRRDVEAAMGRIVDDIIRRGRGHG